MSNRLKFALAVTGCYAAGFWGGADPGFSILPPLLAALCVVLLSPKLKEDS
jgi:hypothetical protein